MVKESGDTNVLPPTGPYNIIQAIYSNIQATLNGNVVGYACTIASTVPSTYSRGEARTPADAPAQKFTPQTKIPVASVSKVLTALAAIRFLGIYSIDLGSEIGPYLPKDWTVDPYVRSIKFRELLSHTSGIRDYGNDGGPYDAIKKFFTQTVDPAKTPDQINPNDKTTKYSNWNFGIFRILLPMVEGFSNFSTGFESRLASAYIRIVNENVFQPIGVSGVDAKPPASGPQASAYAFGYRYPGTKKGTDWGDDSLVVGAAGWYLSVEDIAKVLNSLNKDDGLILTHDQLIDMVTYPLGWDTKTNDLSIGGIRWIQKNGGWSSYGNDISTSIALLGDNLYGALFMNSDILQPGLQDRWKWCNKCGELTFTEGLRFGDCPGGGGHNHESSSEYCLPLSASNPGEAQSGWRQCNKCYGLAFADNNTLGKCAKGGEHDLTGSDAYSVGRRGTGTVPEHSQTNWRWCSKCQVLGYNGGASPGLCGAGGKHDYTTIPSGNYMLKKKIVGADTVLFEAYIKANK